jgi:hypothetical protein
MKAKLFYLAFFFAGIGIIIGISFSILSKGLSNFNPKELIAILVGIVFAAIGGALFNFGTKPIVFDKHSGHFWKGRKSPDQVMNIDSIKSLAPLHDIYALQLISEFCRGSGKNSSSYYSYELNLILNDSERINVVDHGKHAKIREDGQTLARFLNKPLWDAT